jgi:sorting nexin-1/2
MGLEQGQQRRVSSDPHQIIDDDAEKERLGSSSGRPPPPVQVATPVQGRSTGPPSISLEHAAKPMFYISVGDPHKVGDLTSSHIVYSVRTKVCISSAASMIRGANHHHHHHHHHHHARSGS